jgi:hypothetical protein
VPSNKLPMRPSDQKGLLLKLWQDLGEGRPPPNSSSSRTCVWPFSPSSWSMLTLASWCSVADVYGMVSPWLTRNYAAASSTLESDCAFMLQR